jgi:methionyl-tRNA formyltransferase
MLTKKVIFLGSKPIGYECFAYLISRREELGIEIVGLLTNERKEFGDGFDLRKIAEENNIPTYEEPGAMPECDILYSVQYHKILKQQDLDKGRQAAVNLHMAPLPEYRGSNQFSFAILEGKKEFGTTIHLIDSRIDHGDILFQKRFPIPDNCWVGDLYQLTYNASLNLFRQTLAHVINGTYQVVSQDSLVGKFGTSLHYRNEMADLKVIDLDWDADNIERHIRATAMPGFEPPFCVIGGEKVYFSKDK